MTILLDQIKAAFPAKWGETTSQGAMGHTFTAHNGSGILTLWAGRIRGDVILSLSSNPGPRNLPHVYVDVIEYDVSLHDVPMESLLADLFKKYEAKVASQTR